MALTTRNPVLESKAMKLAVLAFAVVGLVSAQTPAPKATPKAQTATTTTARFIPVDTSRPLFKLSLDDLRSTFRQDIIYTPPQGPHPIEALQKGIQANLGTTGDPKRKVSLLLTLATMASIATDGPNPAEQQRYLTEAITVASGAGFAEGEAAAHGKLAVVYECQGNLKGAREEIQRALEMHRQLKMNAEIATDLCNWGMIESNNGNQTEGTAHLEEALKTARASGNGTAIAFSLCNLAASLSDSTTDGPRVEQLSSELKKYRTLTVPFFTYYRRIDFGGMFQKAIEGKHAFYNWMSQQNFAGGQPLPAIGYIEAPYELPWPKS